MNELETIESTEVTERDNLAVVARVEALEPIAGKDFIELVKLKDLGYTVVAQKGHQISDCVIFVKYDTVLPQNELFAFMADSKYRVKAKAFTEKDHDGWVTGKIYSQGIILPLTKLELVDDEYPRHYEEGEDLTKLLGVQKYIPPAKNSGTSLGNMQAKGTFPTHLCSKTDELNLASKKRCLEELQGKDVVITLKIEGSSLTMYFDEEPEVGELEVCSRNNRLKENETNKFWQAVNKHNFKETLVDCPYIFQNELYGNGIQRNKLKIPDVDLMCFTVVEKATRRRLNYIEYTNVCKQYKVPMVPLVTIIRNFDWTFDQLQELADIQKYSSGEAAEGIVIRPIDPFYSQYLKEDFSVKVINRNYSLN